MFSRLYARLISDDYWKVLSVLLLIAVVVIFAGIGLRFPWPADEPRFADVAKEMVASGHWFFPIRGGELYPDKPPIFMWAIAFFYWLTGNMKVAFLLPNALASLVTLVCIYDIAAKLWNVRTACIASLLLLLLPQFMLQAKTAQIDAMVACWITLAMYGLIRHFYIQTSWRWFCASGFFMGLGIITKGVGFLPILFLIPVYVQQVWLTRHGSKRMLGEPLLAIAFMLLAVLCWLLPMLYLAEQSGNPDFIAYRDNIMFKQTGERYANSWHHLAPWYYYLVDVIPSLWFPLSFLLLSPSFWRFTRSNRVTLVLLAWIALVVFFFSLSPGKRGVYLLPAAPILALVMAPWLNQMAPERWLQRLIKGVTWLFPILLYVAAGMLLAEHESLVKHLEGKVSPLVFALFFAVTATAWLVILIWQRRQSALHVFGYGMVATWLLFSTWGYLAMDPIRAAAKEIMATTAERIGPEGELGIVKFREQILLFSPIPITQFSFLSDADSQYRNAWLWMKDKPNRYILAPWAEQTPCFNQATTELMGHGHDKDWLLFDAADMLDTCEPPEEIKRYHMPFSKEYTL